MLDRPRAAFARPTLFALAALLTAALAVPALAQDRTNDADRDDGPALFSALLMGNRQYEVGETIRVEISVANRGADWAEIANGAKIASSLSLKTADGRTVAPKKPDRVGAARTESLGPGGFTGLTVDARDLFPDLAKPGRYTLVFSPQAAQERMIEFDVLPAFDPAKDYWLELSSTAGSIRIDLDEKSAPGSVRSLARLAWTGALDGAVVPRLQGGYALQIRPTKREAGETMPFEPTRTQLLAGTVILEPRLQGSQRVNTAGLVVLLAPQTSPPGSATAVGHVAEGRDVLDKIAAAPTTGADGSPPWQPRTPIVFDKVTVTTR